MRRDNSPGNLNLARPLGAGVQWVRTADPEDAASLDGCRADSIVVLAQKLQYFLRFAGRGKSSKTAQVAANNRQGVAVFAHRCLQPFAINQAGHLG